MRVYVECRSCKSKIYLDEVYQTPDDYPAQIQLTCETCGNTNYYSRQELIAEKGGSATAAGAILGGAVGALGGPLGVIFGASLGGAIGQGQDQTENERVRDFNNYYYHFQ